MEFMPHFFSLGHHFATSVIYPLLAMLINLDTTLLLLLEKLQAWFDATILILPHLVMAIAVFTPFCMAGKTFERTMNQVLSNMPASHSNKLYRFDPICSNLF